jgi:hypothetical protein
VDYIWRVRTSAIRSSFLSFKPHFIEAFQQWFNQTRSKKGLL